jgi:DNA repair exonuclease SbcCD ATPase subunit
VADTLEKVGVTRTRVGNKLKTISEKISNLNVEIGEAASKRARKQELLAKIESLGSINNNLSILSVLKDAYGPKGLLTHTIQSLVAKFIDNLNGIAGEFFRVPFKFDHSLKGRELQILAERNGGAITDVRQLSGFEGRTFALASVASLLPLFTSSRKTNLLILDEMETCLSQPNREILATSLIPKMAQIVPSIFLVTATGPSEFYVPESREYAVVKKKNISRLVEG